MLKLVSLFLLIALAASLFIDSVESGNLCQQCIGEECDNDPVDCLYGIVRDYCGRKVCAKGPGQRCGGPSNVIGKCGEGMHCRCERCVGCFVETLECFLDASSRSDCHTSTGFRFTDRRRK